MYSANTLKTPLTHCQQNAKHGQTGGFSDCVWSGPTARLRRIKDDNVEQRVLKAHEWFRLLLHVSELYLWKVVTLCEGNLSFVGSEISRGALVPVL